MSVYLPKSYSSDVSTVADARSQSVASRWKNLAKTYVGKSEARIMVADLLWVAFPACSEHEVCKQAARALGVSRRTVLNWLHGHNDAPSSAVLKILAIAGAEIIFRKIEGASK